MGTLQPLGDGSDLPGTSSTTTDGQSSSHQTRSDEMETNVSSVQDTLGFVRLMATHQSDDSNETDADLVRQVRKGNKSAWAELSARYYQPCYARALKNLKIPDKAQGAVQQTFLRAMAKIDQLEDFDKFPGWIFRILRNCVADIARDDRKTVDMPDADQALADQRPMPEEIILHREKLEKVRATLQLLPPDYRTLLILSEMHRLSPEEIEAHPDFKALNLTPPVSIKDRLFRARAAFRKVYAPYHFGDGDISSPAKARRKAKEDQRVKQPETHHSTRHGDDNSQETI